MILYDLPGALNVAVSGTAASFTAMAPLATLTTQPKMFAFCANTDTWISQTGAAVAGAAGSMFVPARTIVNVDPRLGATLSVIQDSAPGKASLTPLSMR